MDVLYRDDELLAVNKPSGLITHRGWANDADNALVRARGLAGRYVYPVHRLDRATSGVLLFALTQESAGLLGKLHDLGGFEKRYLALVRGIAPDHVEVDHAIAREPGEEKRARAHHDPAARHVRALLVGRGRAAHGKAASDTPALQAPEPPRARRHALRPRRGQPRRA